MVKRADIAACILGIVTTGFSACSDKGSDRQQTAGTGESPTIQAEQGSEGSSEGTDGTTDSGTEDTGGTDSDPNPTPSEPKIQDVDFTCARGEIRWQIDNTPVELFAPNEFATGNIDDKSSGGTYSYENTGDPGEYYAISFTAINGLKLPGDIFTGLASIYRGPQKRLYSCKEEDSYFKYIEGNVAPPYVRHFEGVVFNFHDNAECSGEVVVKKFSFCINAQNQN